MEPAVATENTIMTDFQAMFGQMRVFIEQHAPENIVDQVVPMAIVCLMAGVILCVLGAKISRWGTAAAFAVLGGMGGAYFSKQTGYAFPICAAAGAFTIAIVGYVTFRLWVGVLAALVFSSVALGAFGYHQVLPHLAEFDQVTARPVIDGPLGFTLPTPDQQEAVENRTPKEWFQQFWQFVSHENVRIEQNAWALGIGAMVIGLCLGVIAMRPALILSSSLIGTAMVVSAIATLWSQLRPGATYQTIEGQPGLFGVLVGGFLVSSLIVQTLITRPAAAGGGGGSKTR